MGGAWCGAQYWGEIYMSDAERGQIRDVSGYIVKGEICTELHAVGR
jgi:hypothetical protein